MATLFDNYEPTATYASVLHEMAKACCDADSLIAFAERVVAAFERYCKDKAAQFHMESMEVDDESENAGNAVREMFGLNGKYRAENSVNVWQALVWMALSRTQWSMIVDYWKSSKFLNPNAMRGMWMDCGDKQLEVPVAMICVQKGAATPYELVMLEEPCCERVHLQVGPGMISDDAVDKYNDMMEERRASLKERGMVMFQTPSLAFIYGVAYVQDYTQWSNWELTQVDALNRREANQRIFVQTYDNKHGYYVPLF